MPDKELSAYAEKVASLPFVTNDGVSMTYGSAIEEICDVVQKQAQKVTRTGLSHESIFVRIAPFSLTSITVI